MHKEDVIVTPIKARTTVRTTTNIKTEHDPASTVNHTNNLHSRLPSADSGIQADGGFDSLSRYQGKTFLSTCSSQVTTESTSTAASPAVGSNTSNSSSGYSSDQSLGSHPLSLGSKVISSPSKSVTASSKPVPPQKPTLTSSPSKSTSSRTVPRPASTTYPNHSLLPNDINNASTKVRPSSTVSGTSEASYVKTSEISKQSSASDRSANVNQNITTTKPVAARRSDLGPSAANRKSGAPLPTRHKSQSESTSIIPSVKVVANDGNVKLSFSKSAINVSSNCSSSDNSNSPSTNTRATTVLNIEPIGESTEVPDSNSQECAKNIFSAPGSALKLQVVKPILQDQGQLDKTKNQGQGCIALTRPLRLGPPSKLSVKTIQPTTLNPQPSHLVPVMKPVQQEQKQQPQMLVTVKPRPKIAPRPSVLAKVANTQSISGTTSSSVVSSACPTISESSVTNSSTTNSQPQNEALHKTEVPVVHRIKTAAHQTGRTEIPVTHVVHRSPSYRNQLYSRPPSFVSRHTPEREKYRHDQQIRQPIYENIRFDIREGFHFDDDNARTRHAELILKQSDELINDALKMFASSPQSPLDAKGIGSLTNSTKLSEGAETSSKTEHRVPILDVRTGKLHSGTKQSYWSEWTDGQVASTNGENKQEVTWKERKGRIDAALSWLKQELADLRDMDNTLISQFKRCQDTIETLKTQREVWEGLSEEGEEGEYWDDYELNEYNRRYLDSPGGSSSGQFSPGSREPSLQDVTLISFPVPQLNLPQDKKTTNGLPGVTQDIEATL